MTAGLHLRFRPVRPADRPRVADFTAHTWDDGDYIADVFDEWLADDSGQFTAAELDGRVVAIGKLTDLDGGELWLEGLRVDSEHRRKGIAEALHDYKLELVRRAGGDIVRYATGAGNQASRRLGARTGFGEAATFRLWAAEPSIEFDAPARLGSGDWPGLASWPESPVLRSARGLYARMWKWRRLTATRLRAHLAAGEVYGLRSAAGLRACSICELIDGWDEALVQHLDGADSAAQVHLARALRRLAFDAGRKAVECFAPTPSPLDDALAEAGYRAQDHDMIVLELNVRPA